MKPVLIYFCFLVQQLRGTLICATNTVYDLLSPGVPHWPWDAGTHGTPHAKVRDGHCKCSHLSQAGPLNPPMARLGRFEKQGMGGGRVSGWGCFYQNRLFVSAHDFCIVKMFCLILHEPIRDLQHNLRPEGKYSKYFASASIEKNTLKVNIDLSGPTPRQLALK